jgi:hypothetical protein
MAKNGISLPQGDARKLAVFTRPWSVSHFCTSRMRQGIPFDKTMPASGTHSLVPSLRGRGLRLSSSWSNDARTQSATAFASTAMVLRRGRMQTRAGGGRAEVPGANDIGSRAWYLHHHSCLLYRRYYPVILSTSNPTAYSPSCPLFRSPPCKRSVSHVHAAAFRHLRGTAHGCRSPQEPPCKKAPVAMRAARG